MRIKGWVIMMIISDIILTGFKNLSGLANFIDKLNNDFIIKLGLNKYNFQNNTNVQSMYQNILKFCDHKEWYDFVKYIQKEKTGKKSKMYIFIC
jgi:hypothetical protein